jgi:16S rRNA (guanine1207-N2)-methyltransferase
MSHYFTNDEQVKDTPEKVSFSIMGKEFELNSNSGVFSKDRLDSGTRLLLEIVLKNDECHGSVLDLGCGIGPVGVVLKSFWDCDITMLDVNIKAVELAKSNMEKYHFSGNIRVSDGIDEGVYDCILLNPPIRAGKKVIYSLFDQAMEHLSEKGRFWIVMRKQHGAQSAMNYFKEKGYQPQRIARDLGYWIIKIEK